MDGLTVDSEPLWFESECQVTAVFGYAWTVADQVACLGGPLWRVGQYMYERCDGAESAEFFTEKLIDIQCSKLEGNTPLMPGAMELLFELHSHGVAIGLVSASPRKIVDAVLKNFDPAPFPFSISSDDVTSTKPDPEGYLLAARKAGAEISRCLIFEDSLTGCAAAIASGAWLIAVPHLVTVPEAPRVRSIKSLEQLSFAKLKELAVDFTCSI